MIRSFLMIGICSFFFSCTSHGMHKTNSQVIVSSSIPCTKMVAVDLEHSSFITITKPGKQPVKMVTKTVVTPALVTVSQNS